MKIAIIGASAGVGLACVRRALELGHEVVTLSRRSPPLPDDPGLRRLQGSATVPEDVQAAIRDAEAVLVTLGTGTRTKATTLCSDAARVLLQALREGGAKVPLIVLTGFGAGDSWDYNRFPMKILFSLLLKAVYADKTQMERLIVAGYPHWEIVRPGRLTDGAMSGRYRVLDRLAPDMRVGAISRADVAHFMVAQAERPTQLGKYVALSG